MMSMFPRSFLRLAAVAAMAVALAGCGRTESYRYKLTLAVNTPDGVKRGSSVAEVVFWNVLIPERGIMQKLRGEALYLDLGAGKRPLIALRTNQLRSQRARNDAEFQKAIRWTRDWGPGVMILSELYGRPSADFMDDVRRISRMRGPRKIAPTDLPDLVTFADISDPNSVIEVDPENLQATLGPNITWNEITLEMTDEPITAGIRTKLPWLATYYDKMLDGSPHHDKKTLANKLNTADFE